MLEVDIEVQRRDLRVAARFAVGDGERLALFGPSGAGKSTILEAVAGLVPLAAGEVRLGGRSLAGVPVWRRRVGLIRQGAGPFPHLGVEANIGYALGAGPGDPKVAEVAGRLGIADLLEAGSGALSGGQLRRVALAQVLVTDFRALLADEPFAGLDSALSERLTALLAAEVSGRAVPGVLVSHQLAEAQAFADRIAVIDAGAVLQVGDPAGIVRRPASRRVAELVGYRCFVADPAGRGIAGIHPGRVRAGSWPSQGPVVAATVSGAVASGGRWAVTLQVEGEAVACELDEVPAMPGEATEVTLLDPPMFAPGGRLVDARSSESEPSGSAPRRG